MSQSSSLNLSIAISLIVSICLWSSFSLLSGEGPCPQCQCHHHKSVSPICPNYVTITCLCCDGFSEVYFLCLLPILSSSCGHSPRVIDDQPHLALAHIRDEKLIALLWRKKIFKAEYYTYLTIVNCNIQPRLIVCRILKRWIQLRKLSRIGH